MRNLTQKLRARQIQGIVNQVAFGVGSFDLFAQKNIDIPNFKTEVQVGSVACNIDMIEIEKDWEVVGTDLINASNLIFGEKSTKTK